MWLVQHHFDVQSVKNSRLARIIFSLFLKGKMKAKINNTITKKKKILWLVVLSISLLF